jgi:diaminohydroxyphosphoribosylaminopyrimidine deaminase/5-amino-6-(5-phosphoribosylamino)uracil reductase
LSDAVLVGAGTVRKDDPALTVRLPGRIKNPARVILDDSRGLTPDFRVFQSRNTGKVYLFSTVIRSNEEAGKFMNGGTVIHRLKDRSHLAHILKTLARDHVMHLMIEGGGKVAGSFLHAGLVNEIWAFIGPRIFGSEKAPGPIGDPGWDVLDGAPHLKPFEHLLLGDDILIKYRTGG